MEDGSQSRRRVVTGKKRSDGSLVPVVLEVTPDRYLATFRAGVDEAVLFDSIEVSKMIGHLRELQVFQLQGVRWDDIPR